MSFWTDLIGVLGTSLKIGLAKPATIDASGLTAARTFTLPDVAGTLGVISRITASPSSDQNDYAPTGFGTASSVFLTPTKSVVITGFSATGISDGFERTVRNDTTDKLVVLADESSSSSAANRMTLANSNDRGHRILFPGDGITLVYDGTATRWKPTGASSTLLDRWVKRLYISAAGGTPNPVGLGGALEGTAASVNLATGSYIGQLARVKYPTTASAGTSNGVGYSNAQVAQGDAAGRGGFVVRTKFGGEVNPANAGASFIGLTASSSSIGNVDASSLVNCLGFGTDATQSTFRILKNDGAGVATASDLGANFPWTATACYDSVIYAPPNASALAWAIWRTDDLTISPKCGYETTDIPSSQLLTWHLHAGNRAAAAVYAISLMSHECLTPD